MVKINFFNIVEFNQILATSQGVFSQEKWLNLGKIFCGTLTFRIPTLLHQFCSGIESKQPHSHGSCEK